MAEAVGFRNFMAQARGLYGAYCFLLKNTDKGMKILHMARRREGLASDSGPMANGKAGLSPRNATPDRLLQSLPSSKPEPASPDHR